jgi:V8-like Glu-specific endopeptidase
VKSSSILAGATDTSTLQGRTFGEAMNLCADEPFREQKSAAFCSGFLVNEDTVVTAGHCIRGPSDCSTTKFVFGYGLKTPTAAYTEIKNEEIYSCQSITHTEVNNRGADFAVIKLDRRVLNHRTAELRREGAAAVGSEVVVIGHPSGLPTKVAAGAKVRRLDNNFFVASLDTYGGNSGSAVFNNTDGKVEGILVRGETDFRSQGSCTVSNRCAADGCRGEDVTMISTVLPHIR